jgi:hypothetical protein
MATVESDQDYLRFDLLPNKPSTVPGLFPSKRDEELGEAAQARLFRTPYHVMRRVDCSCQNGVLILRGRVPSYYHKQYAEEVVADLPGLRDVSNQLQVITPPQWDLIPPGERREERRRTHHS